MSDIKTPEEQVKDLTLLVCMLLKYSKETDWHDRAVEYLKRQKLTSPFR